jgi:ribonuclease P protein component
VSARFPPAVRLKVRRQFTAVQDRGRRVATKYMTVLGQPNGGDRDRLGIIASRRLGDAVVRNRAKRRVREIFRRQRPAEPPVRSLDLVVIPRRELVEAPFAVLETDFSSAVSRLRGRR